jgi:hypothetical protein
MLPLDRPRVGDVGNEDQRHARCLAGRSGRCSSASVRAKSDGFLQQISAARLHGWQPAQHTHHLELLV